MADIIQIGLSSVIIACQIVVLVLAALALGGGTWIEQVRFEGDYFTRIQSGYGEGLQLHTGGDMHSIGMWRYFSEPGRSNPLPTRDAELTTGTACYVTAIALGCFLVVLLSYQLLGIQAKSVALTLTTFWVTFFEFVMLLVASTVVLHYFKQTFRYERLGHSHHVTWVSFSFSGLSLFLSLIRLIVSINNRNDHELRSDRSDYRDHRSIGYQRTGSVVNLGGNNGGTMNQMRPISPKSVNSLGHAPPYNRDSYGPNNDYRGGNGYNGYDYDMRPQPPKNYVPS